MAKVNGIGDLFKSRRLEKGLTLTDVENETKIRTKYLQAIEEEDFAVIPGKIYLKGFIKTYAKYLHINDNEEINNFLEDNSAPTFEIENNTTFRGKNEMPKVIPKKYITVVFSIIAILVLFGVQSFYEKYINKPIIESPAQPDTTIENPVPPITEEPPVVELPQKKELIIEILDLTANKDACWMQVYSDSNLVYEGTMYQGELKTFEAEDKIKIKLGNAGVVKLVLGETDLGIPGKTGQIIEKEFILSDFQ